MVEQRHGRSWRARVRDVLDRLGARDPAPPPSPGPGAVADAVEPLAAPTETERLARFLAAELRLPLAALARLGARCARASEPELAAVGRALARESERLDVMVMNTLELGLLGDEPATCRRVDLQELLARLIAGHRALIEGLTLRVRVADCSRAPIVAADRVELLECLCALFSDLVERVPRRGAIELRLRELHGLVRLDVASREAAPPACADRTTIRRARALVDRLGGELWELENGEHGFGLTLPNAASPGRAPFVARRLGPLFSPAPGDLAA